MTKSDSLVEHLASSKCDWINLRFMMIKLPTLNHQHERPRGRRWIYSTTVAAVTFSTKGGDDGPSRRVAMTWRYETGSFVPASSGCSDKKDRKTTGGDRGRADTR
jgi:hypothetical protein